MYRDSVAHSRFIGHGLLNIDRVSIKWTSGVQRMYHHNSVSHLLLRRELEEYEKRHVANALRQGVMRVFAALALLGFCPRARSLPDRPPPFKLGQPQERSWAHLTTQADRPRRRSDWFAAGVSFGRADRSSNRTALVLVTQPRLFIS